VRDGRFKLFRDLGALSEHPLELTDTMGKRRQSPLMIPLAHCPIDGSQPLATV
jgi:hypothetical protein